MDKEIFVILREQHSGYQSQAVAASEQRSWVEDRLARLSGDQRDGFRVRQVQVDDLKDQVIVFYDRWSPGGDWELSGFGSDPEDRPKLPIEPEERRHETLRLNEAPEDIFGREKQSAVRRQQRSASPSATYAVPTRRHPMTMLWLALLAWLCVLATLMIAAKMRPIILSTQAELPEGLHFPIAYQDTEWVEHAGWHYMEGTLSRAALDRVHTQVVWRVIGEDEPVPMRRPRLLSAQAHQQTEANFIYAKSNVEAWRERNFITVTDGYLSQWDDGSVLVFDLVSNRIYGRLTPEVAHELFGG